MSYKAMKTKPLNQILAHHDQNGAILWELPGQGVYLAYSDGINFVRICSKAEFDCNQHLLVN
jgi:hypothetical protein